MSGATRSEFLAAQLLQRLNKRMGRETDPAVLDLATEGRERGVELPPAARTAADQKRTARNARA